MRAEARADAAESLSVRVSKFFSLPKAMGGAGGAEMERRGGGGAVGGWGGGEGWATASLEVSTGTFGCGGGG